ncbi:hypothetical protein BGZ76_006403, partial [Entomortierella beljakovae]
MLDYSLDDIIKLEKQAQRKLRHVPINPKGNKFPTRSTMTGRITKTTSRIVLPEKPLFTKSYRSLSAPVKEIYTSRYIPQTAPIKLTAINTNPSKSKMKSTLVQVAKSIRLETTQKVTGGNPQTTTTDKPRNSSSTISSSINPESRGGYRASDNNRSNSNRSTPESSHRDSGRSSKSKIHTPVRQNDPRAGKGIDKRSNSNNSIGNANHHQNNHGKNGSNNNGSDSNSNSDNNRNSNGGSRDQFNTNHYIKSKEINSEESSTSAMDVDEGALSIRGMGQPSADFVIKDEDGPVTIEIENLDPGTTSEDVKFVCSRFGEIRSCICSNGYSQVTFARRAAGLAAVSALNGKKADNDQILRVSMRKNVIFHGGQVALTHGPSPISGPMKLLSRAVEGT